MKRVLFIGTVWPEPSSSAAGRRIIELVSFFKNQNYSVHFASHASKSEHSYPLEEDGIITSAIELNNDSFNYFLQTLQPDIVLFDRFMTEEQYGWRVAENCPEALRILDTEDLHFLRHGRQKAFKEKREFTKEDLLSEIAKREIASIFRCDLSLIISTYEMELLKNEFQVPDNLLYYLPFANNTKQSTSNPSFEERKDFVFIGNFIHPPNWDCVRILKTDIWPRIVKKIPESYLHIYGAYPSQKVFDLHSEKEHFLCHGRAENVHEVLKSARILLAPVPYGAGLKGKFFDAMACGTPSITTSIGIEGIAGSEQWPGTVIQSECESESEEVELYTNKQLWEEKQERGYQILKQFEAESDLHQFAQRIEKLAQTIDSHRKSNFIGQMLLHHRMASTKYLSKWIVEKNRMRNF